MVILSGRIGRLKISSTTMSHKPPIDISALKKEGLLNEEDFFRKLSEKCNYIDERTVRNFYLGVVKVLTEELRKNGVVRLPHIGDFAMLKKKPSMGISGTSQVVLDNVHMLKFYPNRAWKDYFTNYIAMQGEGFSLDPRQKVLKRKLSE